MPFGTWSGALGCADGTAFHLALENTACLASASCKPSPGQGRGKQWARGSAAVQSQEERLETPKKLFSDTTWKVPLFATSIFNASEL